MSIGNVLADGTARSIGIHGHAGTPEIVGRLRNIVPGNQA